MVRRMYSLATDTIPHVLCSYPAFNGRLTSFRGWLSPLQDPALRYARFWRFKKLVSR